MAKAARAKKEAQTDSNVQVRLPFSLRQELETLAEADGRTLSGYMRHALQQFAQQRQVLSRPKPVPSRSGPEYTHIVNAILEQVREDLGEDEMPVEHQLPLRGLRRREVVQKMAALKSLKPRKGPR